MYHAITKSDIRETYSNLADGSGDSNAVKQLFGMETSESQNMKAEDLRGFVKTGDILVFHSNRSQEIGHVALVLDNFEKLWVASHWCLPREKMIRLTPNRIFETSKESALRDFSTEVFTYQKELSDVQNKVSILLQLPPESDSADLLPLRASYTTDRAFSTVKDLYESTKRKHTDLTAGLAEYALNRDEVEILDPLLKQASDLISDFEKGLNRFETNKIALGILYDHIDTFEQKELLSPLEKLEYLVDRSVTVLSKFRPYFQE